MDYLKIWMAIIMNKRKNKNDKIFMDYLKKNIGMTIQTILMVIVVVLGITTIFNNFFNTAFMIVMGLTLLVLAYNNHKIYKRKLFTILYLAGAVLAIVSGILG